MGKLIFSCILVGLSLVSKVPSVVWFLRGIVDGVLLKGNNGGDLPCRRFVIF
jgi:hypothetical protein